jgi:hypothetical protein
MDLIILLSSTIIVSKNVKNEKWMDDIEMFLNIVPEPELFTSKEFMRSVLFCTYDQTTEKIKTNDIFKEIQEAVFPKKMNEISYSVLNEYKLISILSNWFGNIISISWNEDNIDLQTDIRSILSNINLNLNFGLSLTKWNRMTPIGFVLSSYISHCVGELNFNMDSLNIDDYKKIIENFGKKTLQKEAIRCVDIYSKLLNEEIKARPLEMTEIVELNESYTKDTLSAFNHSIKDCLIPHQIVGEFETLIKISINNSFRNIFNDNSTNSENFCYDVFDSCFKWINAELVCGSKKFHQNLYQDFFESLAIYLKNSVGTKKFQVLEFSTKNYTEKILSSFPELKKLIEKIINDVDLILIKETLKIDTERSFLQKRGGLKLKLQSIENTIHRLNEEILEMSNQKINSKEWYVMRNENLSLLKIVHKDDSEDDRNKYLTSLKNNLGVEIKCFRQFEYTLKNLKKRKC